MGTESALGDSAEVIFDVPSLQDSAGHRGVFALSGAARAADLPLSSLSVRVYGFLNAEVEWVRALGGTTPYTARMRVSDGNSRVGIFGSWNFAPNTAAQLQLEALLNNFEQGGTLASRNSFAAHASEESVSKSELNS